MVEAMPKSIVGLFLGLLPSRELAVPEVFSLFLSLSPFFDPKLPCRFRLFFCSPSLLLGSTSLSGASS